jgi:hypothetical protein
VAAKPLDIWRTPSSTHWQYPPKRIVRRVNSLWAVTREASRVLINISGRVPIREHNRDGRSGRRRNVPGARLREKFGGVRSGRFPPVHAGVISAVLTVGDGQTAGPSTPQIIASRSSAPVGMTESGRLEHPSAGDGQTAGPSTPQIIASRSSAPVGMTESGRFEHPHSNDA